MGGSPRASSSGIRATFVSAQSDCPGTINEEDFATIAYTKAGSRKWVARYNGGGADLPRALAAKPDGDTVYVTGPSCQSSCDYATVAYDGATGALRWLQRYDGGQDDEPTSIAMNPDGTTVFVTGFSTSVNFDFYTIAYDAATGSVQWWSRYGPGTAWSIAASSSTAYVSGTTDSTDGVAEFTTVAYVA